MLTEHFVEILPSSLFIENVQKYAAADSTSWLLHERRDKMSE